MRRKPVRSEQEQPQLLTTRASLHAATGSCCQVTSVVSDSVRPQRRQPTRLPHPWDSLGKNAGVGCHFLLQCMKEKSEREVLSCARLLATPWTAAHQAPPSMGLSRQEHWSGLPLPSPLVSFYPGPHLISFFFLQNFL